MDDDLPLCVAYLHVLLAGILHSLSYHPVYDYSEQDLANRIMRYVSDHACEEITLETVSHAVPGNHRRRHGEHRGIGNI